MTTESTPAKCPLCGGQFEPGHVSDMGRSRLAIWIEGEPAISAMGGLKTKGKRMYELATLRCVSCGHVVSFANSEWQPGKK